MQQSSLILFCDECGLANEPAATHCAACQHPLTRADSLPDTPQIAPVTIAQPPVLEVTPGPLFVPNNYSARLAPRQYPMCDFRPGSILAGRYEVQEEIGRGGFSIVYRAVDRRMGFDRRPVPIKRIQLSMLSPRQVIDATETFNRKITALARFKGMEGVPARYEHFVDAENWYLVMQYVKGQTLEEYLQKAPGGYLEEEEALRLGIVLADILQSLYTMTPPVILRDLKPANLILTPDGKLFLIDFGIARFFTPGKAKDTTPLGSPGYAPPEQYGRAQTDQRADIYSLGATLQTMLTGRDPLELRSGEPSRNPRPPSRALRKLLDQMLSPEAAERPASMSQVKKRLEFIQNRPLAIFMVSFVYGAIWSIFFFLNYTPFGQPLNGVPLFLGVIIASLIAYFMQEKFKLAKKTPKGFVRFWVFGLLAGLLPPILLFIIQHVL